MEQLNKVHKVYLDAQAYKSSRSKEKLGIYANPKKVVIPLKKIKNAAKNTQSSDWMNLVH